MLFKDYKHVTFIQVRFSDIDRLGHVNNACYLSYSELGRISYFNDVYKENINWDEKGFVLARIELDYILPLFLRDEIYCFSKVLKTGTKSVTLKNSIVKKINNEFIECAAGICVLVAMDYLTNKSIVLPEKWVELTVKFEGY